MKRINQYLFPVAMMIFLLFSYSKPSYPQSIRWLGQINNSGSTYGNNLSPGGEFAVGRGTPGSGFSRAFLWSSGKGMLDLGTLGGDESEALDVSADGSKVVGWAEDSARIKKAFIWDEVNGMMSLGTPSTLYSEAHGITADGEMVVGFMGTPPAAFQAFIWNSAEGLKDIPEVADPSTARDISSDGRYIVGMATFSVNGSNKQFAYRYDTLTGKVENLGSLGGNGSEGLAVSDDGSTVVGWSYNATGKVNAFRWKEGEGIQGLGTLGGESSFAEAVSADGNIVVGWSETKNFRFSPVHPFRWTPNEGIRDMNEVFASVLQEGSELIDAKGISPDGRYIIGTGYHVTPTSVQPEAYILDSWPVTAININKNALHQFELYQNYPNPFNPTTTISFSLKTSTYVKLQIFNAYGQLIKTLYSGQLPAGFHSFIWDARDVNDNPVPSGIYFYTVSTPSGKWTRKMILMK